MHPVFLGVYGHLPLYIAHAIIIKQEPVTGVWVSDAVS